MQGPRRRGAAIAAMLWCLAGGVACGPMIHVATEPEGAPPAVPADVTLGLHLRTDGLEITLANSGETPVDVLWDKTSLVDTQGHTYAVVHSVIPGQWTAADTPGNVSRIPPHATLNDVIVPTRCVRFSAHDGWIVEPLLPVECGPVRCVGYHELVGRTVRLTLVIQAGGSEHVLDSTLRITRAEKSVRGGRPKDPSLH